MKSRWLTRTVVGITSWLGGFAVRLWRYDLYVVQGSEVAIVDFRRNLVADLHALHDILFVRHIHHSHGVHPALNLLTVHRKCLGIHVDFFDLSTKCVLFLSDSCSIFVLLRVASRAKEAQR